MVKQPRLCAIVERQAARLVPDAPKQRRGTVQIAEREIAVRAVRARGKRLRDAVDRAYLDRYNTRGAIKYARDLGSAKSGATTLELRPLALTRRYYKSHYNSCRLVPFGGLLLLQMIQCLLAVQKSASRTSRLISSKPVSAEFGAPLSQDTTLGSMCFDEDDDVYWE